MRASKRALAAAAGAAKNWAACEDLRKKVSHGPQGNGHVTPWDEPARDWGPRRNNPLWAVRKMFRRERFLGTW